MTVTCDVLVSNFEIEVREEPVLLHSAAEACGGD